MPNPNPRILLSPPHVGQDEREALLRAFDSNWISTAGPEITAFEDEMAALLGRPCVALSSGTAGLHLALRLVGVSPGDLVLCQTFTFVATANPILYEGAVPCFLDSEPDTWNLCPNALEHAIASLAREGTRPKALMLVHLYGMPARIEEIRQICARHGIPIVEDAAEALGSRWMGQPVGTFGKAGILSFNGNKIITTAGGGMLVAESPGDAALFRKWSTQSREPALHYEHQQLGFNYRMSNLLAALGRAQLGRLPAMVARRREIAEVYRKALGAIEGVHFQPEAPDSFANRWLSALVFDPRVHPGARDSVVQHLASHGIESRPLWKPMHRQPLFRNTRFVGGDVADSIFASGLCLPSSSSLSAGEQTEIIERIRHTILSGARSAAIGTGNVPIRSNFRPYPTATLPLGRSSS